MKRVAINTLGCKVNQYESSCIVDDFLKQGYELVHFDEAADVYIINTCTVTNRTDFKSRNLIRKALKSKADNPLIRVIVTGCFAELNRQQIEQLGAIDVVAGNDAKKSLYELLIEKNKEEELSSSEEQFIEMTTDSMPERVRAFVKIQDGCSFYCAYCIVPYARGNPRSRDQRKVVEQIERLTTKGYKEFVIAGINLGLYGRDLQEDIDLSKMLRMIEDIEGVAKIRLSSIEPQLIDDRMLDYFRESRKLCPHFHIPLQSGSDRILKAMNRHYDTAEFSGLLTVIKDIFPDAAIGTDIILGLPGETESLFAETYRYLQSLPIAYAHVFPYSIRTGTAAAAMKEKVVKSIAKERCRLISDLVEQKKSEYVNYLIDNKIGLSGIAEKKIKGYWTALSDHYIRIYVKNEAIGESDVMTGKAVSIHFDGIEIENRYDCDEET